LERLMIMARILHRCIFSWMFATLHHSHFLCRIHNQINCILPPTYTQMSNISNKYKGPIGQIRRHVGIKHMLSAPANTKALTANSKTIHIRTSNSLHQRSPQTGQITRRFVVGQWLAHVRRSFWVQFTLLFGGGVPEVYDKTQNNHRKCGEV